MLNILLSFVYLKSSIIDDHGPTVLAEEEHLTAIKLTQSTQKLPQLSHNCTSEHICYIWFKTLKFVPTLPLFDPRGLSSHGCTQTIIRHKARLKRKRCFYMRSVISFCSKAGLVCVSPLLKRIKARMSVWKPEKRPLMFIVLQFAVEVINLPMVVSDRIWTIRPLRIKVEARSHESPDIWLFLFLSNFKNHQGFFFLLSWKFLLSRFLSTLENRREASWKKQ